MYSESCFFRNLFCAKGHKSRRWSSQPKLRKRGVLAGGFLLATNIMLSGKNYSTVAVPGPSCKMLNGNVNYIDMYTYVENVGLF